MAKKQTGKQLQSWDEQMAKDAALASGIEESVNLGGNFVSTKGGRLSYAGAEIPGNKMNVVVLDHILEYTYYEGRYDPENPQPPAAYAFGRDEETLRWHEDSISPYAGELCKDSDINQWGSAEQGRGKACKNSRRLALITEGDLENVEAAEIVMLKIPVTSVKGWAGYARQIADQLKKPPYGVLTEVSLVPDAKTQFKMKFKLLGTIDDGDTIGEIIEKRKAAEAMLFAPYTKREDDAPAPAPAPRQRSKVSRKAARR